MGLFIVALSCMMVSPGFRRIGDLAADTLVVYTAHALSPTRNISMAWLAYYEKIIPPRLLSNEEKQNIILFSKRFPLLGETRANEIAKKYAENLCNDFQSDSARKNNFSSSEYILGIARTLSGDDV
jgi:hypothetical protein